MYYSVSTGCSDEANDRGLQSTEYINATVRPLTLVALRLGLAGGHRDRGLLGRHVGSLPCTNSTTVSANI